MSTLRITRGLPASGKSTWAEDWVNGQPGERARVNRDDLRFAMFRKHGRLSHEQEHMVTVAEVAMAEALLKGGKDVIVDAMHLRPQYVRRWNKIALKHGAFFEIDEFEISIEESCRRNVGRYDRSERSVPEAVILDMRKYLTKDEKLMPYEPLPELPTAAPYVADPSKPPAIIVDIDGTVALHTSGRNPYDMSRVHEDTPNHPVVSAVQAQWADDTKVIFLSAREDIARKATEEWIKKYIGHDFEGLFMRAAGDSRRDAVVKRELFDERIRDNYNVLYVLDDRDQVVDMWRSLGLTCLQVAPGNF